MIQSFIQIENGAVLDFYKKFGFIYMNADERVAADEKEMEESSYKEDPRKHIDPRTVDAPFDYTAKFLVEAPNKDLTNVNAKIIAFNSEIRISEPGSDIKRCREISFYNILNRVKIVGIPDIISIPKEVYHSNIYGSMDFAIIELKIDVLDPGKCDFNLSSINLRATEPNDHDSK